jgi:exodeoxyribonuclease-3
MDIYPRSSWDDDALVQPQCRAAYAKLVVPGWTDAIRSLHPEERIYTFWHFLRPRWDRNASLRLDHFLFSPAIASRLRDAGGGNRPAATLRQTHFSSCC